MYIEPETEPQPVRVAPSLQTALAVAVLLVVLIGVYPQPLLRLTQKAAQTQGLRTHDYEQKKDEVEKPPGQ
jgi:NADH:ubiquinone oxidoreductase subunit 2 (subunit N)